MLGAACSDRYRPQTGARPGRYFHSDQHPLANETAQRREALALASKDADWVIQLDTDEVLADPDVFADSIRDADTRGFAGVEFPARVFHQHIRDDLYLELCRRFWAVAAHYPGPVAVRAGSSLTMARQGEKNLYRVDFRPTNTDPLHPDDAPVHRVIGQHQALMHYSRVRSDANMRAKANASGHATDLDWDALIASWTRDRTHPWLAVARTPLQHGQIRRFLRLSQVPGAPDSDSRRRNGLNR